MSTVGDVIARHSQEILHLWAEGTRREDPAGNTEAADLTSIMPAYLAALGQRAAEPALLGAGQDELLESHLSNRLRHGSELNQVAIELDVLGRCLGRVLDGLPADDRPPLGDVARLYADLYAAVTAVTRLFGEQLLEDARRDRGHDRLLQRIASAAMSAPDGAACPSRVVLDEALTVVMTAMRAQAATLLTFDPQSCPIVSSSTGIAAEDLARYVSALDASVFADLVARPVDRIATAGDAGPAATAAIAVTAAVSISPALEPSGIHSVLGVRIGAGQALRGALYIGICEERAFTAGDARRLEDLGASLTMYLENARLRAALREQSQSIAHEGELREAFVSVLMHDLTGPLQAAKLGARRLREPWGLEEPQELAAKVVRELERTEWMVRGLLDVHRIRTGQRLAMHVEECDLGAIARDAIEELRTSHGNRFVVHADRNIRGMWSAEQLRRAIWNLAVNGIEHGAIGRPVAVSVVGRPGGAEVSVHNEGPAIPRQEQADLFHPFSLPGSPVPGAHSGWGMGLTFVWGCMEAHGGQVIVESLDTQGTTFRLLLPYDARPYAE
jgi:signal transduction histidine kinase